MPTGPLGVEVKEIEKLVKFNYPFIAVVGIVIAIFSKVYNIVPLWIVIFTILVNILATFIVHYLAMRRAWAWVQVAGLSFLSFVFTLTIAYGIIFFNADAQAAALLIFVPSIVLQASLSLTFGILSLSLAALAGAGIYFYQIINLPSNGFNVVFLFIYFFLIVLGLLANYAMEILRRKEREIQRIAKINEDLYQMSKTTSDEIVKNMHESLVAIDASLKIVRYNDSFANIVAKEQDLINKEFGSFADKIGLDINLFITEIKENKIKQAVVTTSKDQFDNEFESSISPIELKEGEEGYLIILNKKINPWGKVFESGTNRPINLAIVRLIRTDKDKTIAVKVTDDNGNFSFIVPDGEYRLTVSKNGYTFPTKTQEKSYKGEKFQSSNNLVNIDIALDAQKDSQVLSSI